MDTRRLGNTDLMLTSLGLGTWAMGGGDWAFGWGPQGDQESIATIHRALDLGINWIDVAPVYGLGHSETIVGKALKQRSDKPIIATKCGRSWDQNRQIFPSLKRETVRHELESSLKRLDLDHIDLYQIHWPMPEEDIEEAWTEMAAAVQAGKVRYIGVCNFNQAQLQRLHSIHPLASLQPPYSLVNRAVEKDAFPFCLDHHIGVVAYSPMQKGIFTDKFSRQWRQALPDTDHRSVKDPQFQEPLLSLNLELTESLQEIAQCEGRSLSNLAIGFVLSRPEVTSAIVGARTPLQIEQTVGQGDWTLGRETLKWIEGLLRQRDQAIALQKPTP